MKLSKCFFAPGLVSRIPASWLVFQMYMIFLLSGIYTVLSYVSGCLMHKIQAFFIGFQLLHLKTSQPSPLHLKKPILCWGFQWLFTATTQQRAAECYVQGQSPIVDGDSEPGQFDAADVCDIHTVCGVEIFPYIYIWHTHTLGDFFGSLFRKMLAGSHFFCW